MQVLLCSGGIHRDWVGVPRMLFSPGSGHSRCVCIQPSDPVHSENRNLREYKDCPPQAESCQITKDWATSLHHTTRVNEFGLDFKDSPSISSIWQDFSLSWVFLTLLCLVYYSRHMPCDECCSYCLYLYNSVSDLLLIPLQFVTKYIIYATESRLLNKRQFYRFFFQLSFM